MIVLPLGSAVSFNNNAVTEHNRSALEISYESFEGSNRMSDATLRKYVIGRKRSWSVSWENLPSIDAKTVDGKWGANSLINFWETTPGAFTLKVKYGDGKPDLTVTVVMSDFSASLVKRSVGYDMYSVSLKLEEV